MLKISDFSDKELLLARLLCAKTAMWFQGLVSVGISSCLFDAPTDFLTGRDKTVFSLLTVLGSVAVKPGTDTASEYSQKTAALLKQFDAVFEILVLVSRWREMETDMIAERLGRLYRSAETFLNTLNELAIQLGASIDFSGHQTKCAFVLREAEKAIIARKRESWKQEKGTA